MAVSIVVFAGFLALGLGASRLRSVVGLAALAVATHAGLAVDQRSAAIAVALPAGLALLTADALRLSVIRLAAEDRRRPVQLLDEHDPRQLVR